MSNKKVYQDLLKLVTTTKELISVLSNELEEMKKRLEVLHELIEKEESNTTIVEFYLKNVQDIEDDVYETAQDLTIFLDRLSSKIICKLNE